MIKATFYTYKDFTISWEINNPNEFIREIVLNDSVRTCLEKINLYSPETGERISYIPSDIEVKLKRKILDTVLEVRDAEAARGTITTQTIDLHLSAIINDFIFSDNVYTPVQVIVRISKNEYFYITPKHLQDISVFYDPSTKKAWIGKDDLSTYLLQKSSVEEAICSFVKEHMDKIFSDSIEAEEHFVETILQANGIIIDTHNQTCPTVIYRGNNHCIELPLLYSYLSIEVDGLPYTMNNGVLKSTLLTSLYAARKREPAFAIRKHYVRKIHVDGKHDTTKFFRNFTEHLSASLIKAEEQYLVIKNLKLKHTLNSTC